MQVEKLVVRVMQILSASSSEKFFACTKEYVKNNLPALFHADSNDVAPLRALAEKADDVRVRDALNEITETMSPVGRRLGTKTQWAILAVTAAELKAGKTLPDGVLEIAKAVLAKVRQ